VDKKMLSQDIERIKHSTARHHDALEKIVSSAEQAHCVVQIVSNEISEAELTVGGFPQAATVRVQIIASHFGIYDTLHEWQNLVCQPPVVIYLLEYDEVGELVALRSGAEDVLNPTMTQRVLTERIMVAHKRTMSRPSSGEINGIAQADEKPMFIDTAKQTLELRGECIELSKSELKLMQILSENRHRPVSRKELCENIADNDEQASVRIVDSHVKRLRNKFEEAGLSRDLIKTTYGAGYRFAP